METDSHTTPETTDLEYDRTDDYYVFQYDPDGPATLTTTVVHAIASVAETDVSQGEFSLYDSVDPDALERLFATKADGESRRGGHVMFEALGHEVYVFATGEIRVYPQGASDRPVPWH